MENKILEILNNIVSNISEEIISQDEREKITVNVNKNSSVSFMVFKNILLKITFQKAKMFVEIRKLDCVNLDKLSKEFKNVKYKENELYVKIYLDSIEDINKLDTEVKEIYKYLYSNEPTDSFGCCSRYIECSDSLKCTNADKKFAKGCQYKGNLESGKIFYGKNKNI